jgi:hypothetical protein
VSCRRSRRSRNRRCDWRACVGGNDLARGTGIPAGTHPASASAATASSTASSTATASGASPVGAGARSCSGACPGPRPCADTQRARADTQRAYSGDAFGVRADADPVGR